MVPNLHEIYRRLASAFGPQHWWPATTALEVMVGAVLTQNTAWKNVERAIANLRDAGVLQPQQLHQMPVHELAELIRPAGYFRVKSKRLKNLMALLVTRYDGCIETMFSLDQYQLREQLLSVNGVGPETADSIVLYAAQMPSFVVDTYTARVLKRHGWIEPEAGYDEIKDFFESRLEADVALFNEYHALLVRVGNQYCRKNAKCEQCPLFDLLPESGIERL